MEVVVEHLEECLSPWLLSEYSYVVKLFGGRALFTNVRSPRSRRTLASLGARVEEASVVELVRAGRLGRPVVLDPRAPEALEPGDLAGVGAVVIGGIMGDHPPRGRTYREITSRLLPLGAVARNLGRHQLTIAGAAYVLKRVEEGARLESLDIRFGLSFSVQLGGYELTIELPYAFPYEGGRPVLPEGYLEVVARRSLVYESRPTCLQGEE